MTTIRIITFAVLIAAGGLALLVTRTPQAGTGHADRTTAPTAGTTHGAPLRETVSVAADEPIPNLPGKRLVARIVDYPQERAMPLSGAIRLYPEGLECFSLCPAA